MTTGIDTDREDVLLALDRAFNKIVQELFPIGTKNAAMKRKPEALAILMEELGNV